MIGRGNALPIRLITGGRRNGVVAFFGSYKQAWQTARRRYLHLDLAPLAVVSEVRRLVPDGILVTQFQRNLLEDVVHFGWAAREKSLAPGNTGQLIEDALTFHAESAARIATAQNSDAIQNHVRLLQQPAELVKSVSRVVVLSVAN